MRSIFPFPSSLSWLNPALYSFVKYCPDKVFKYNVVDDKVSLDDPLLVTEFNDQCLGRKVTDSSKGSQTTTRVMDYVQIAWKPSFHFKVEVQTHVSLQFLPPRHSALNSCLSAQSTGVMPSHRIIQIAMNEMKKKLVRLLICCCLGHLVHFWPRL